MTAPDAVAESSRLPDSSTPHTAAWHPVLRVVFRFFFVYFGLYVLTGFMLSEMVVIPGVHVPRLATLPPLRNLVVGIGAHVLRLNGPLGPHATGSGDTLFDWIRTFVVLLIATLATVTWSLIARPARDHERLYRWFRLFLRLALGATLLDYGLHKVFPVQMPTPGLERLVEPYGNFSPMGVLWASVGASPAYEMFVGWAETCAGLLLFVPRTALLGALLGLMDVIAVFTLNMTYDVPVKLFSFHLVLMSAFLVGPNVPRLYHLLLRQRAVALIEEPPLGRTPARQRIALVAQIAFGSYVLLLGAHATAKIWAQYYAPRAPRSALYGLWNVDRMIVDGGARPPSLGDSTRWRRVIFDDVGRMSFQHMNDTFTRYRVTIDTAARALTMTANDSARTQLTLSYQRPSHTQLVLDGTMRGHAMHVQLSFLEPDSFLLRSRGFHWIQEFPFNR